jgi:hypothetical protein
MADDACQKTDGELRHYPPPSLGLFCPDGFKHSFSMKQKKFCLTEPYSAIFSDQAVLFILSVVLFSCILAAKPCASGNITDQRWTCENRKQQRAFDGSEFCEVRGVEADLSTMVLGATVGAVAAICIALLIYLIRRNPQRAKRLLLSFLRVEARMVANMMAEACKGILYHEQNMEQHEFVCSRPLHRLVAAF